MQDTATIKTFPRLGLSLVVPEGTDVLSEQPLVLALPLSQERCQVFGNDGWRTLLVPARWDDDVRVAVDT
jgi:hypothetical protein